MKSFLFSLLVLACACGALRAADKNYGDFPGGAVVSVSPTVPTWILTNNPTAAARFIHVRTNSPGSVIVCKLPAMMTLTNTYSPSVRGSVTNIFTNTSSWVTYTNLLIQAAAGTAVTGASIFTLGAGDAFTWDAATIWRGGLIGLGLSGTNAVVEAGEDK
jgi:hypothetical protein